MSGRSDERDLPEARDHLLRDAALATSASILVLQQRAEQELLEAKVALEERTRELARSFSLLNATLESMPYGIVAVDLEGTVVSHNSKFVALWGIPRDLLERADGAALEAHIARHVRDPDAYLRTVRERQREPEAEGFDVVELTDGRTFERHVFPQRMDEGSTGVVVNWRDITERQRLEGQLRQAQKMEAVGTLAAGIAHDFNNLLNVVIGTAELVQDSLPAGAPQRDDLGRILLAGERAATLTRQLLTFARPLPVGKRTVDLVGVVRDLHHLLRRLFDANIEIVTDLVDDPWPIAGDPAQMDQLVMNLAINGRDAMPDGGRLSLSVANTRLDAARSATMGVPAGDYVELTVADTGHGMTADVLEHAFDPFYTTKQSAGSGLGLSTVYGIVQRHGGRILTETAPGSGATFRVLFPRASVRDDREAEVTRPAPEAEGQTILLVEDDQLVRTLANRLLSRLGYRVIETAAPADAVSIAEDPAQHLDLLLSDVMMPSMTGPEVAARVRRVRPDLPILLMSGYSEQAIGDVLGERGGYHFIAKPFTAAKLGEVVRAALGGGAVAESG